MEYALRNYRNGWGREDIVQITWEKLLTNVNDKRDRQCYIAFYLEHIYDGVWLYCIRYQYDFSILTEYKTCMNLKPFRVIENFFKRLMLMANGKYSCTLWHKKDFGLWQNPDLVA